MKKTKIIVLLLAMLATGTIGFVSCQKQLKEEVSSANTTSTAKEDKDEKDDEKLQSRENELKYYERILCLGLLNVSINPTFKNIALQLTQENRIQKNTDYYATFAELNTACQNAGFNMVQAMKNSVVANGGTTQDANNLQDIVLGFKIKGIDLEPGLRLSYRDSLVPNLNNIHRVTCRQLYKPDSIPTWTLNADGTYQESLLDKNTLDLSPTWTVNILKKDKTKKSKYLYTVPNDILRPNWWCIYYCCRKDHATNTVCLREGGTGPRCRCVDAVSLDLINSL
jgi:hypothetical protein